MEQPQSPAEVQAVVVALQTRLDRLLDIRWNPKAIMVAPARFNAYGFPTIDAVYAGRWQVIRWETPSLEAGRNFAVICTVTKPDTSGKYPVMVDKGEYMPIGEWLVGYMALWDRAQSHYIAAMDELWKEHDLAEAVMRTDETEGNQEALERVYRNFGSEYWMGGAQGKTANAPWLGAAKQPAKP